MLMYCISSHPSNRYAYAVPDYDYYIAECYDCAVCGRTARKLELLYWPPRISLEGGKRYPDCLTVAVPFSDRCGLIVSEKAYLAFQRERLSGFRAVPIEIDGLDSSIMQYYYLTVEGSVSLDYQAMHFRKKHVCPACGSYSWSRQKVGVSVLDQDSWDGSDFCKLVDYPNFFICTQKVVDIIKSEKLKGFAMRQESEIFMPLKDVKIC